MPKQVKCPKCNTQQPLGGRCVSCGLDFREYARKLKEKRAAQGGAARRVKCPKCKTQQPLGGRCVSCGLDFREYARKLKEKRAAQGGAPKEEAAKPPGKPASARETPKVEMPAFAREPELSGVGELLGNTWLVYRGRSPVLIGLFLIALALMAIPTFAASVGGTAAMLALGPLPAMGIWTAGALIGVVAFLVFFGGVISAVCDETQKFGEAVGRGWRNLRPLLWLYLLAGCVVQGGLVLLVVPGIIWMVSFFAFPFIMFDEGIKGMPAMLKSRAYVKGHWLAVFLRLLVVLFLVSLVSILHWVVSLVLPPAAVVILVPVFGFANLLWCLAFTPFMMVYMSLLYRELRRIKGGDVEFRPPGRAKTGWIAVAVVGAVVPLAMMVAGGISLYKSAPDMTELKSMVQNEMARIETGEVPGRKKGEAPAGPEASIEPELTLDKTAYVTGERMTASFRAPSTIADGAWVGIVPSTAPHDTETDADVSRLASQALSGRTSGELGFRAPAEPGIYDIRMYDSARAGKEAASETFAVERGTPPQGTQGSLGASARVVTLKRNYTSGEPITIEFAGLPGHAQDWVTLVPASASDNTQKEWFYTGGLISGRHTFSGVEPGSYEVRVYFDWPRGGYNVQVRYGFTVSER